MTVQTAHRRQTTQDAPQRPLRLAAPTGQRPAEDASRGNVDRLSRAMTPATHKDPTMRQAHKLYTCVHAYVGAACSALDARPLTPGHVARADEFLARATETLKDILAFEGGRPDTAAIGDALTTIDVRDLKALVALAQRLDVAQHTGLLAKTE